MKFRSRFFCVVFLTLAALTSLPATAQDWVRTGSNLGNAKIRIAAADFKPVGADPQTPSLKATFDATLYNDLGNAGIFDLVSKSFAPPGNAGFAAGDQPGTVVGGAGQRGNGGVWRTFVSQRTAGGVRLAR